MSMSTLSFATVSMVLVLTFLAVIPGCITPQGPDGVIPITSIPSATTSPEPDQTTPFVQTVPDIQLVGNVYGLSSDPLIGIDTITFSIRVPSEASAVDLTRMQIVFSTPGNIPVTFTQGTRDTTSTFTTTSGNYAVTSVSPGDEVDISFRIKPVTGDTKVNIEVRLPGVAAVPISRTVPAMISATNILN